MSILKAILLTLLGVFIFTFTQLILLFLLTLLGESISSTTFVHLSQLSIKICFIISYSILFYAFWSTSVFKELHKIDLKVLKPQVILFLFLIFLGLELVDRVIFDFNKIYNYYLGNQHKLISVEYNFESVTIYRVILALLIAPVFEELFFRKFLLGKMLLKNFPIVALIVSSILFSLIHLETPNNLIPTFLFGLISGFIFIKTKKILYCMFLHFLLNLFWLLLLFIGEYYNQLIYSLDFNIFYWMLPILGVSLIIFGTKRLIAVTRNSSTFTDPEVLGQEF